MSELFYYLRNGEVSQEPVAWDDIPISAEQALPADRAAEDPPPWIPVRHPPPPPASYIDGRPPRVIEQTAKTWKANMLVAAAIMIFGMLLLIFGINSDSSEPSTAVGLGAILMLVGFCHFIFARIMSWWYHG